MTEAESALAGAGRAPGRYLASYTFRKKPGGSPYYPDNANHLAACTLVRRILDEETRPGSSRPPSAALFGPLRLVSWEGGGKDKGCAKAGVDARIVAAMEIRPGADKKAAESRVFDLAADLGAECELVGSDGVSAGKASEPQGSCPGIKTREAPIPSPSPPEISDGRREEACRLPRALPGKDTDGLRGDLSDIGDEGLEEATAIFRSLVRVDTSNPPGREKEAVELLSALFAVRGIEHSVYEPAPDRANVIARIPGGGEPPVVLLSHLDVVPADPSLWKHHPFGADEADGSIWGRGTLDTKQLTAMQLAAFLRLSDAGVKPNREVVFAATADEEAGSGQGMGYLSGEFSSLAAGSFCISEGGGFPIRHEGRTFILCTAGEKGLCRVRLSASGTGGAGGIAALADGVRRLLSYASPPNPEGVARAFLDRIGIPPDPVGCADETTRGLLRHILSDSVVLNSLRYGTPGAAAPEAEVELRLAPSMDKSAAGALVDSLLEGSPIAREIVVFEQGFESDLESPLLGLLERNCGRFGLDAALLPILALGRTDGRFLGRDAVSVYGFSPVLLSDSFGEVLKRVHGVDERISLDSFRFGCKVLCRTLIELCAPDIAFEP